MARAAALRQVHQAGIEWVWGGNKGEQRTCAFNGRFLTITAILGGALASGIAGCSVCILLLSKSRIGVSLKGMVSPPPACSA